MSQFDLHRLTADQLVIDCQSDFLGDLKTRLVVPLVDPLLVPAPLQRLHPVFEVDGNRLLMATHFAGAIPVRDLGPIVGSLSDQSYTIMNALDFLLTGV